MEKKTIVMKTKDAVEMYNILNAAKYSRLDDADKIRLWKIVRALKPVVTKFNDDVKDAQERFQNEFENFAENLAKAQKYEAEKQAGGTELPMTEDEYKAFLCDFLQYRKLADNAVNECMEGEVTIEVEKISEDAFGKLMASNDWTVEQSLKVDSIIE